MKDRKSAAAWALLIPRLGVVGVCAEDSTEVEAGPFVRGL